MLVNKLQVTEETGDKKEEKEEQENPALTSLQDLV